MSLEGIDELRCDPHSIPGPLHAPLQHVLHTKLLAHLTDPRPLALVAEGGFPGDDEKLRHFGEGHDQAFAQPIAEEILALVSGHVYEGHDGDGRLVRQGKGHLVRGGFLHRWSGRGTGRVPEHCGPHHQDKNAKEGHQQGPAPCANLWLGLGLSLYRNPWLHQDLIGAYRFGDILDRLFSQKLVPERKLGFDVLEGGFGNADPAGVRQGFQPRRDVHPVTVDAVRLFDHIPEVDPDAKPHSPVLWKFGVAGLDLLLHRHSALDRIHDAGKLGQDIVPGRSHHSPAVLRDEDEQDLFVGFQGH